MEAFFEDDDVNGGPVGPPYNLEQDDGETAITSELYPREEERRNAYYDYTAEKTLSHADAKVFYQRHRLEQQNALDAQAPTEGGLGSMMNEPGFEPTQASSSYGTALPGRLQSSSFATSPLAYSTFQGAAPDDELGGASKALSGIGGITVATAGSDRAPESKAQEKSASVSRPTASTYDTGPPLGLNSATSLPTSNEAGITPELNTIYTNIQRIIDTRHKYIRLSLQRPADNPKDEPTFPIYPPPPEPVWDDENNRPLPTSSEPQPLSKVKSFHTESRLEASAKGSMTSLNGSLDSPGKAKKWRKPGFDIGEDFDIEDLYPLPNESEMTFKLDERGVFQVYETAKSMELEVPILYIPTIRDFYMDLDMVLSISSDGPSKSFAFRRLQYLEGRYNLYFLLNEYQETAETKRVPHRDFYNVRKVDTHVHHSSCMNQKHLLRFIKSKMKKSPDEIVMFRDGKDMTLAEVFKSINLTAYDLSIDTLDMHAHTDSFHRFDKFNLKYNPIGESRLRTIFMKTDNHIKGRYLAELTKQVISDLESSKYQMVEWRISIYGRSIDEWDKLAAWVVDNKLFSHNVRWLIQVPRLYDVYKASGLMDKFEQVVINVFQPLFEVTKDPNSHPKLHVFLQRVIGFDCVDDESKPERRLFKKFPLPRDWEFKQSPPYSYWIYYLFANITSLNAWRKQRGFNTFVLRPHCGEAGDSDHLAVAVLCCHSISHGITLRKVPLLQYIFYLEQIGMAMSPLSNNALFLAYERNPFLQYFRRGLNVSLSTDDPLQIAFTKEPLIEEYSVATQIYKLNAVDMCELAKNSVLQSGFEHSLKKHWLGNDYHKPGVRGNNVAKTNVPDIRVDFRYTTLTQEKQMINRYTDITDEAQKESSVHLPPGQAKTLSGQEPPSPSASMKTNVSTLVHPTTSSQAHGPDSTTNTHPFSSPLIHAQTLPMRQNFSAKDFQHLDTRTQSSQGGGAQIPRSMTSPKEWTESTGPSHIDGTEPRIFPGLVHERTRQKSLRKGSISEQDFEGLYLNSKPTDTHDSPQKS